MYDLERYLFTQRATGGSVDVEGTLWFLFNVTSSNQVWSLEEPGAWPTQRTFFVDPVSFVSASPTRPEVILGKDADSAERTQLHLLAADGSVSPLTETPDATHYWGGWSPDGDRFAFTANRRDGDVFDLYTQHRDGSEPTLVTAGDPDRPGSYSIVGWSPDQRHLALRRSRSPMDQRVAVVDLDDGAITELIEDDEPVRYRSVQWAPDGDGLYLVTDRGRDTLALARLDLDGTLTQLLGDDEWNVDGVSVHSDSGRFVYSRNVDGYGELSAGQFTDATDFESLPAPDLPGDVCTDIAWGPRGDRFAVTASGRSHNSNVYVVDVETGTARRWTDARTGGIPESTYVDPEVVRYESIDGLEVPALFSLPRDVSPGEDADVPVVVDVHGGPARQRRPTFEGLVQYYLSRGYAVLEPNVRGSTGYGRRYTELDDRDRRSDCVGDLEAAADWLRDRPEVDADRVALQGTSYGGYLVLSSLVADPERWAAGVCVSGIADLVTFLEGIDTWRRDFREREYGSPDTDGELLESLSPITDAERIRTPLFVVHGEADPRVPVDQARHLVERVQKNGQPVEAMFLPEEGHGLSNWSQYRAYTRISQFLSNHL